MLSQKARLLAGKSDPQNSENWLPLWMHGRDTAEIIKKLVQYWLPQSVWAAIGFGETTLLQVAIFLGYVHDIGKATCLFQHKIMKNLPVAAERLEMQLPFSGEKFNHPEATPHACASEAILLHMGCAAGLASVAGAHHGKAQTRGYAREQIETFSKNYWGNCRDAWEPLWQELLEEALEESGFPSVKELPALSLPAQILLSGLLIMADWIASNPEFCPTICQEELGNTAIYPERTDEAWEKLALTEPWDSERYTMDEQAFLEEFGFRPNAVQLALLDAVEHATSPGIYILEAQMGVGKTEAALASAEVLDKRFGCGGMFFGLPTQATANGIFSRLLPWAEKQPGMAHSVRLAHGMAMLNERYRGLPTNEMMRMDEDGEGGLLVHSWFAGNKQALLADFSIGTVDQLLMAALKQKHVMLRHLGVAGKVVIIDECHAYDTYMNGYLDRILQWLGTYRVPVILLSATLPEKRRKELIYAYRNQAVEQTSEPWSKNRGYPLLTSWTPSDAVRQAVIPESALTKTVHMSHLTESELPGLLSDKLREGGCAGVIVNTVKKAQRIAAVLRETLPNAQVLLLHAQFIQPDRAEKEKDLIKKVGKNSTPEARRRFIVVGTQVLEQSLDIDFDFLITELCPMDLLLQRIGRLHRHARIRPKLLETPCCAVLDTGDEGFDAGSCAVYTEWLLWRTRKRLPERIALPQDIPALVQDVYSWEEHDVLPETPESAQARQKYEQLQAERKEHSKDYQIKKPEKSIFPARNVLDAWMDWVDITSDGEARAAVRDGDPSVEVLVMTEHLDGSIHFLPWQENGASVLPDREPSQDESLRIAGQRLRLPGYFARSWNVKSVITELENQNKGKLPQWQLSPMLKGELVLLLDENFTAVLAGMRLRYDRQIGLTFEKEERHAGDGI